MPFLYINVAYLQSFTMKWIHILQYHQLCVQRFQQHLEHQLHQSTITLGWRKTKVLSLAFLYFSHKITDFFFAYVIIFIRIKICLLKNPKLISKKVWAFFLLWSMNLYTLKLWICIHYLIDILLIFFIFYFQYVHFSVLVYLWHYAASSKRLENLNLVTTLKLFND